MATRLTSLQIGSYIATLAAGVALGVFGGKTQVEQLDFVNQAPAITGTGADATNISYERWYNANLTATGSLAKYNTLSWSNPLTITGAITGFCIDVKTAAEGGIAPDVGVVTDAATGTSASLFNNESLTRGTHCADVAGTTEVLIGPDERIKAASLAGSGESLDAEAWIRLREARL